MYAISLSQSGIGSIIAEAILPDKHPAKDMVITIRAAQATLPLRCMTNASASYSVIISVLRFPDLKHSQSNSTNRMLN